jgi:hypothetical protein
MRFWALWRLPQNQAAGYDIILFPTDEEAVTDGDSDDEDKDQAT